MSKASCIVVAYSELQVRKTLKPFKFVLFTLQFWHISYIGMTTRHLGTRIQEHLHHKTIKSTIREHFERCQNCKVNKTNLNGFKVLRTCNSEYATTIQEALLIKKHNPQLNRQLYANGSSFLLNVY